MLLSSVLWPVFVIMQHQLLILSCPGDTLAFVLFVPLYYRWLHSVTVSNVGASKSWTLIKLDFSDKIYCGIKSQIKT